MLLVVLVEAGVGEKAEATPRADLPVAAFRDVFRNAAREQRNIVAFLPNFIVFVCEDIQ